MEFLINLTMVSQERVYPYETVKVLLRSNLRNIVKTPPPQSLILEDIMFLVDLEMVADERDYPFKASFCESFIRIQHPKIPLFLHVSSWNLGGHVGS